MNTRTILMLVSLIMIAGGCETSKAPSAANAEIISSLESQSRTTTYVALWTLEQNGVSIPEIDFEKPYDSATPQLKQLAEELAALPQDRLSELDESLKYHWSIYSPMWSEGGNGWKQ